MPFRNLLRITKTNRQTLEFDKRLNFQVESLEDRTMLSTVEILAAGSENSESMSLEIDGVAVQAWDNVGGDAESGTFESYIWTTDATISADQMRIRFANDTYDPENGIDENLRIDAVLIDGVRFEAEDPSVFSTGTWKPEDGIVPGNRESEFLHGSGYLQFAAPAGDTTTIIINARGDEGTESFALEIGGARVQTWDNISTLPTSYEYVAEGDISANDIRVYFLDDRWDPEAGIDENLIVDNIVVGGTQFETEDPAVFSTGTWKAEDGIVPGNRESEFLHASGYFQFADNVGETTEIIISARGQEGTESFALEINGTRVQTWENIPTVTNAYIHNAEGVVTADDVRIYFLNDRFDPETGFDSNLIVDSIVVGGVLYQTEALEVFSTGTWIEAENAVLPGNRQSEVLHSNGYFQYSSQGISGEGEFRLESSQYSISESTNAIELRVIREGSSTGVVTVEYVTVDATASAGQDFVAASGTLVFQNGETEKTISITILDDEDVEDDEQFGFTIDNIQGNATLSAPRTANVLIDDNDSIQGTGDGLLGEYFDNINLTNRVATRIDKGVNFDWGSGIPIAEVAEDTFSVRWSGQIEPRYSESYTFTTTSDDGIRLWINDRLIIDQWNDHSATEHTGQIALEAGVRYNIRMEYYENAGQAVAKLSWSSASQTLEFVPTSQLYSANDPGIPGDLLSTETIASGFNRPTAIEWSGDGQNLYVAEQGGVVYTVRDGARLTTPFIDISAQVNGVRDRGLLDIAVHPDFETTPYVYLLFTYDPPEVFDNVGDALAGPDRVGNRAGRLIRVTADAATNYTTAVAGSEVVLLGKNSTWENFNAFANSTSDFEEPPAGILPDGTNIQDFIASDSESHTVGALAFGIDGNLFVSIGDGTSYNRVDPRTVRVQDIDNLSGKVLRIDPIDGRGLSDNPFFNGDPEANRSKVYQYGLRNPFRMTVDPSTGQLFIGDVGWTQWEEVNTGPAGANFGWPYFEGGSGNSLRTNRYRDLPEAFAFYNSGQTVTPPVYGLSHSADGINAIVMGDVYRGTNYPSDYQGALFVNDLGQGIVRAVQVNLDGTIGSVQTFATGANLVVQMKVGPDGNMYFVDLNDAKVGRWVFV